MRRVIASAIAILAFAPAARAGEAEECANAYEHGQELRVAHQPSAAREQFLICARPACPKAARDDCARWLGEVEAALPGVSVRVTSRGALFEDARVLVDGRVVAERVDARPITLDPGRHLVRVEPRGCAPHEREVALSAGVPVEVSFDVCTEPKPLAPIVRVARRPPIATFVLGGVSLVGLASFAVFGAIGVTDSNRLRSTCYPHCDFGSVDAANAELAAADGSLGVAIACAAAAAILWIVSPRIVKIASPSALARPLQWSF